jgi:hypothetical protein
MTILWQFKIVVAVDSLIREAERFWSLPAIKGVVLFRKIEMGLKRGWWLSRKLEKTVLQVASCWRIRRSEQPQKSSLLIRAAQNSRPLHKLRLVELVWKIETGLKRGLWLPRLRRLPVRNTVLLLEWRRSPSQLPLDSPARARRVSNVHRDRQLRAASLRQRPGWLNAGYGPARARPGLPGLRLRA